ncbi:hypothetical protein [Persicirhabdus sediminis]|uniref:Uncharacterized protein n=1 Tax=Persicirhabdus sediminis TaxID=454144 RepID=A0A8J7MFX6_9BACT|nr:hypothetical protein [Persicirhabdus sediminis]MBK1792067.1 hypothetical protein [Persicirhabdus sediminis]
MDPKVENTIIKMVMKGKEDSEIYRVLEKQGVTSRIPSFLIAEKIREAHRGRMAMGVGRANNNGLVRIVGIVAILIGVSGLIAIPMITGFSSNRLVLYSAFAIIIGVILVIKPHISSSRLK